MNDFIYHISNSIYLYQEGDLDGMDIQSVGQYLIEKTYIPSLLRGFISKNYIFMMKEKN